MGRHSSHSRHRRSRSHDRSRRRSRSKSKIEPPKIRQSDRSKAKSSKKKKYGLILNANKTCGVRVDKSQKTERKYTKQEDKKDDTRREDEDMNDEELLRQMMDNADEYDKHRRKEIRKYQRYQAEREESPKAGATQSKYLEEVGTTLYMNHSDSLQSRLSKNKCKLLRKNQM